MQQRVDSARVAEARSRAEDRAARQRAALRTVGWAITVIVAVGALNGRPRPSLHGGAGLWVMVALVVYLGSLVVSLRPRFVELPEAAQFTVIALMGGAGVTLSALQPHESTGVAPSAAVLVAVLRLPLLTAVPLGVTITVALDLALAVRGNSASAVLATTLLCVTLGLIAHFLRQSRASQEQTEILLAQLEDAREAEAEAAALAERARIAGDLHDVLAHSLSGAAIQLQGARMLAQRSEAAPELRDAVERASDQVKDGLVDARRAVAALRGDESPGVEQLPALVASFRDDMNADVELVVEGEPRRLAADAGVALYRGAQEALTNVARYAPGATTTVLLTFGGDRTTLRVEDRVAAAASPPGNGLPDVGGGRGLSGMRERVERAGGRMQAGPTPDGWRVELEVPT